MSNLERFRDLFFGLDRAYGKYEIQDNTTTTGIKKKGHAITVREPLLPELYEKHLFGTQGLGIIPICDDGTVRWGAIDVDVYDLDLLKLEKQIRDTPLILCRSKSGGGHMFAFFKTPAPAAAVQEAMTEIAASLGFGGSEIYPKQTYLLAERGDVGQWLNLPYFGGDITTRYCIHNGSSVSLEDFLNLAESKSITEQDLGLLSIINDSLGDEVIPDGPPCLQILVKIGFPDGTRNKGLYNLGVFLKKAFPDDWRSRLEDYNRRFMQPPLDSREVLTVQKSLEKKDYNFQCTQDPLKSHCNRSKCVKRKFGVRSDGGDGSSGANAADMPIMGGLTKVDSQPPQWFIDVEGFRVGPLDTEDLFTQERFKRACIENVNIFPPKLTDFRWRNLMKDLLDTCTIIEMPEDSSSEGQLWEYLEQFCIGRARCENWDELIVSEKPFVDTETGRTYFRLKSFLNFLKKRRFDSIKGDQKISAVLQKRGGEHTQKRLKNKVIRLWSVPSFEELDEPLTPAKMQDVPF